MKGIVLTGGHSCGKTTALGSFHNTGYWVGDEVAGSVIRKLKAVGLSPWPDARAKFILNHVADI